jgi:parallel beta-helix repeat protein
MADNHVTGSSNDSHGGAIYLGPGASPTIANCVITRNTSNYCGGGIYSYNARPFIINCTITRNVAVDGGAIYCRYKPEPTLTNCILWGNTPNEVAKDLDTKPPTITYSVVQGGHTGAGNVKVAPKFVSSGDYYHLTKDSPCINRGTSSGAPEKDIDGDPRPQGSRIDIGADEYTKEQEKEQEQKPTG